jgi:ABC-2 type transport system permease protein
VSATNALLYLYGTSFRNSLVARIKRLRQPKYLAGAVVGGAYFYFFLFRNIFRGSPHAAPSLPVSAGTAALYLPLAALVLFVLVALGWILPSSRAALLFTEAGVAFLFPAPLTRRMLIHSQLLRSQIAIFFSAFFLTLVFRRGSAFGGNALTHALGWWLILSTLNLHLLAASFVREWMLDLGLQPGRRRLVLLGVLAAVLAGCWLAVRGTVPAPTDADAAGLGAMADYANRVLTTAPVSWVLAPFRLVVAPYFATTLSGFLLALGPALLLMALHYMWVVRTNVSFEEASLELATKRAERIAAYRAGRWRSARDLPTKPRAEPFALAARGWVPVAYLWKNLIALGSLYRLRTWLIACAVAAVGLPWLGADPTRLPLLKIIGAAALMFTAWTALFIPMLMRREMQQTLEHMDIVKSYPLPGWQVVLGGLVTPMTLMVFIEWWLLLVAVLALGSHTHDRALVVLLGSAGAGCVALLLPPLCGLMLCIPFAGVLYFPAWAQPVGTQSAGGIEVMGQRLIFMLGYVVVLIVAVLPAAGVGAVVFFLANAFLGQAAALVLTALTASLLLCAELAGAVYWLGEKVENFDLSTELPR